MLTAYYSSQSVKLKQHIMGLKCKAIFLNMRICPYTPGTHQQGLYVASKENLCLMVCNGLAVRVTHFMMEVLVDVLMTSTLLWDVTPCHQHSGGVCYLSAFVVQEEWPYPKNGYILFHCAIYAWK
jgi:hypothetical protein